MNSRDIITRYSEEIARLATAENLARRVPSCPDWTVGDLVHHLGGVHHFWARAVLARAVARPPEVAEDAVSDDQLVDWARVQTRTLLDALNEVGPDSPCWTWWGEPFTSGAVERHQVQEAAIHHWDAHRACGAAPEAIDTLVARDGVAEFLEVEESGMRIPEEFCVQLGSTDTWENWSVGDVRYPGIEVVGTASDLLLLLNGRIPLSSLEVQGDPRVVQAWLDSIDLT